VITIKLSNRKIKGYKLLCAPGDSASFGVVITPLGGVSSKPVYIKIVDSKPRTRCFTTSLGYNVRVK